MSISALFTPNSVSLAEIPSSTRFPKTIRQARGVCGRRWTGQLAQCSCYTAWMNGKWAVGAKGLCMKQYSSALNRQRWACRRWMRYGRVVEDDLDRILLKTVHECGGDQILVTARISMLKTTERLFFLPIFAIIAKQAALAAARAAARVAANAIRQAALARARATGARKAAQKAVKRDAKEKAELGRRRALEALKNAREKSRGGKFISKHDLTVRSNHQNCF